MLYYHNPRCSKSRQGLELLKENGIEPTVKEYLKEPMTKKEIKDIFSKLDITPTEGAIRVKEATFKELGLKGKSLLKDEWAKVVTENPVLLERPILVTDKNAAIGRPPENLLEII